jgi:hypothetical protein
MRTILLIFIILSSLAYGQRDNLRDWCGHYEGLLFLEFPDRTKDSLFLSFDFQATDDPLVWRQLFVFKSEKYGEIVKDYLLKWDESYVDGRHYFLDERNGILIDETFLNNAFYAHYEVLKSYYQTILRKTDNGIYFEIVCSRDKGGRFTKSLTDENDKTYEVTSSLVFTIQYAELRKIESARFSK